MTRNQAVGDPGVPRKPDSPQSSGSFPVELGAAVARRKSLYGFWILSGLPSHAKLPKVLRNSSNCW